MAHLTVTTMTAGQGHGWRVAYSDGAEVERAGCDWCALQSGLLGKQAEFQGMLYTACTTAWSPLVSAPLFCKAGKMIAAPKPTAFCGPGTLISVEGLFDNVPLRKKVSKGLRGRRAFVPVWTVAFPSCD